MCATCAKRPIAEERSRKKAEATMENLPALIVMDEAIRRLRMAELSLLKLTRKAVKNMNNLSTVHAHRAAK